MFYFNPSNMTFLRTFASLGVILQWYDDGHEVAIPRIMWTTVGRSGDKWHPWWITFPHPSLFRKPDHVAIAPSRNRESRRAALFPH